MYIEQLLWSDYRIDHIANHNVDPDEVQEICDDPSHLARRIDGGRYRLYGQTATGRFLFVVIGNVAGNHFEPITARDMTLAEKHTYRKIRK